MRRLLMILFLVVVIGLAWYFVTCGPAQDEAMEAGIPVEHFRQGMYEPDFFRATDGGVAMTPAEIRGRNTWWIWTGGNEAFWDWLANNSFGTLDLLKTISSYPCSPEQEKRVRRDYDALGLSGEGASGYGDGGGYDGGGYGGGGYGDDGYSEAASSGYGEGYGHGYDGLYSEYACGDTMYPERGYPPYHYYDRETRFCYTGLINEPGFRKASQPDEYGLCLDEATDPVASFSKHHEEIYGRPTGVLGLRLFPNPNFDQKAEARWKEAMKTDAFYRDPSFYSDQDLVRPYRVGMSCGFCHISHHPLHPPEDPENPEWSNLSGTIGAQYFWFGRVFAANVTSDNFIWHLVGAQKPGAVDTSFIPNDNLFNPRAMNAVFELPARLEIGRRIGTETAVGGALDLPEVQGHLSPDGDFATFGVPHVLWDGADSVGIDAALTRVYINIGEYHQQWIRTIDVIRGLTKQSPITVESAQENSVFWNATQERAPDMASYLIRAGYRYPLEDAPGGESYLGGDLEGEAAEQHAASLARGRTVFAENCARCHSSKLPETLVGLGEEGCIGPDYLDCWKRYWEWTQTEGFKTEMREIVSDPDFLVGNFLSNDVRVPVHQPLIDFEPEGIDPAASTLEEYLEEARQRGLATGALESEICSAMASNAIEGHVWDNFSSKSYKSLPSVGTVELYNPITDETFPWETPGGGRGYQRVPSLVAIWSTAPFLHNNELGEFTGDPSVEGRMAAFDDAVRKLLWPERRPGIVPRSDRETRLKVQLSALGGLLGAGGWFLAEDGVVATPTIPEGTPVSLVGNLNLARTDADFGLLGLGTTALGALKKLGRAEDMPPEEAETFLRNEVVPDLIDKSACPDFIVDRGHYFGTDLADEDKEALIDYLKTL